MVGPPCSVSWFLIFFDIHFFSISKLVCHEGLDVSFLAIVLYIDMFYPDQNDCSKRLDLLQVPMSLEKSLRCARAGTRSQNLGSRICSPLLPFFTLTPANLCSKCTITITIPTITIILTNYYVCFAIEVYSWAPFPFRSRFIERAPPGRL